jgi:hypothetical protein
MDHRDMKECPECGADMQWSIGPGRFRRYRREDGYELPAHLGFPTCPACGAEWLTDSQLELLSTALEQQRALRRSETREGTELATATNKLSRPHPVAAGTLVCVRKPSVLCTAMVA